MCDALTQVADTPMTWINRALQLEVTLDDANMEDSDRSIEWISQACDAYRAALQVDKHPAALLGLAISFRILGTWKIPSHSASWEGSVLVKEYQARTSADVPNAISCPLPSPCRAESSHDSVLATKQSILASPHNGNTWLSLSKQLLLETPRLGQDEPLPAAARAAVARARQLLLGQLTSPSTNKYGDVQVLASSLSQVLGMESFLDMDDGLSSHNKAQLALLICPQNALPRSLLLEQHS
jgi:hypothetical protein